jgi:MFS family permease
MIGVVSFFADFTYQGSRSIIGPYLATLQASGAVVSIVTGFGELAGYGLRLFSGRLADVTGRYWPVTLFGYAVQMSAVPALALTHNWPAAAALIILERVGKAIRNPSRDAMLSHAGQRLGGVGWAFGLHEALDQFGALFGPLVVAAMVARAGDYRSAFAALLIPALINLSLVVLARTLYPTPQNLDTETRVPTAAHLPHLFWLYLGGAALVAAGFVDYPLIAFHFSRTGTVSSTFIAVFYAIAMGVSGIGALALGRALRSFRFRRSRGAHACVGDVCASRLSRRLLDSPYRCWDLGPRHGRARIDHSGRDLTHGSAAAARRGLRPVYRRIRCFLVCGKRGDRRPLRRHFGGRHRFLYSDAACGGDDLSVGRPAHASVSSGRAFGTAKHGPSPHLKERQRALTI